MTNAEAGMTARQRRVKGIFHAWAGVTARCPRKGCRRNRRCLTADDCRAVRAGTAFVDDEARREAWQDFRLAVAERFGLAP